MAFSTRIMTLLFGRPLATSEERAEHIGPIAGIPIFGLDALTPPLTARRPRSRC